MEVRLLGQVQASCDGRPIPLGSDKQRLVLAILALEAGRQVTMARLVDLLWPDGPPRSARATVQTLIWRLRSALTAAGAERYGVSEPRYSR